MSDSRILYVAAIGLCAFILYGTHIFVASKPNERESVTNAPSRQAENPLTYPTHVQDEPQQSFSLRSGVTTEGSGSSISAGSESTGSTISSEPSSSENTVYSGPPQKTKIRRLSDAQRFVLKKKLTQVSNGSVRLVRIGNEPETRIVHQQLNDAFIESGWNVERQTIGTVSIGGTNFPARSYLTSPNIAEPIVGDVFSIFSSIGIDLPLTPNAFMGGQGSGTVDVVIVIK